MSLEQRVNVLEKQSGLFKTEMVVVFSDHNRFLVHRDGKEILNKFFDDVKSIEAYYKEAKRKVLILVISNIGYMDREIKNVNKN